MTTTVLAAIPSPAQGVWQIGPIPIRAYALFIIIGIIAALVIGDRRWEARGGERGVIYDIALWAVPFGLIGGRLYHVMTDWWRYFGDGGAGLLGVVRIWDGGLGIWGAVAFGGVGAWIACRRRGIPLPAFGDAVAPGIVLAQAIGRLGNYFNQELWGAPTTLPWALEIYERRDASGAIDNLNGVSTGEVIHLVHPTFLYELLWNLLVFAVLIWVDRRFKFGHGRLFALYVAGYCLGRFWIELLRVDDATLIEGVRINTFTATFVFIGAVVYIMAAPKGREDPASLQGDAEPADDKSTVEELSENLAAVAAPTGVVAAAKVASEEDEAASDTESEAAAEAEALTADVAEAPDEDIEEAVAFAEAGDRAEAEEQSPEELGAEVAGVPADDVADAEQFAVEGEEDPEAEAVAEAEALAEDVAEAPAEDIEEAVEFAEAGDDAEAVGNDDDVAEELAVAADGLADEAGTEADSEGADTEADDETAAVPGDAVGGVGAVEGEDAAEALAGAGEAHESAVEGEASAAEAADDTDDAGDDDAVGGVGAVEGEDAAEALTEAGEAHESAVEGEASAAADDTDEAGSDAVGGVGAVEGADTASDDPAEKPAATAPIAASDGESAGRLRRLFRRRR